MLRRCIILLLALALPAAPLSQASRPSAAAQRIDALLTHGSDRGQFLAVVVYEAKSDGTLLPVTTVHFRPMGGAADSWSRFARFDARVLALAQWGGNLAVLLETAQEGPGRTQLRFVHNALERGRSGAVDLPGPALPPGVTLTDIAGGAGGAALLALGSAQGRWAAWSLAGTRWQELLPLPEEWHSLPGTALDISSAGGRVVLAGRIADDIIVLQQDGDRWQPSATVRLEPEERFILVDGAELHGPLLYIYGTGDRLVRLDDKEAQEGGPTTVPIEFRASPQERVKLEATDPRTAAVALGSLRIGRASFVPQGTSSPRQILLELALDPSSLEPVGDGRAVRLSFPAMTPREIRDQILMLALYGLLVVAVVASLRQRPIPSPDRLREVAQQLAPLSLRATAGLIDALPLLMAAGLWWLGQGRLSEITLTLIVLAGGLIYLGHLMVAEAATGRSLGKALFGLKVVRTDGLAPGPGAIILRNVLRPLDAPLAGLGMALLNPLSQRLGDIAAGTVVIRAGVKPPKP